MINKKIFILLIVFTLFACGEARLLQEGMYGKPKPKSNLQSIETFSPISPISPILTSTPTWDEWIDGCQTGFEDECGWWW